MPVVMVIAILAVIAGVVFAARGRGGELSVERGDYVPLDLGPVSATDVALFRPSTGLWGYSMQATDEALDRIAEAVRERDVRIVALEQLVTDLGRDHAPMTPLASPYAGARHRRMQDTAETASPPWGEPEQQQWQEPETQQWQEPETQPWREPEQQQWREPEPQTWQEPETQTWQGPEQQPWREPELQTWQEPEQQTWQEPEPPWQAPEPPRPAGDTPAPPPERSHD